MIAVALFQALFGGALICAMLLGVWWTGWGAALLARSSVDRWVSRPETMPPTEEVETRRRGLRFIAQGLTVLAVSFAGTFVLEWFV